MRPPRDRRARREHRLHGATLAENDMLFQLIAAANRDPDVFADPDHFNITRTPNNHLFLGLGIHFCLGGAHWRAQRPASCLTSYFASSQAQTSQSAGGLVGEDATLAGLTMLCDRPACEAHRSGIASELAVGRVPSIRGSRAQRLHGNLPAVTEIQGENLASKQVPIYRHPLRRLRPTGSSLPRPDTYACKSKRSIDMTSLPC